jgi:pimeloyl-ACP methyl ester carboxylesterase
MLALCLTTLAWSPGCMLLELAKVREAEMLAARYASLSGTVGADFPEAQWVVVFMLAVPCDADWDALVEAVGPEGLDRDRTTWSAQTTALVDRVAARRVLAEYVVLRHPGYWYANLAPGCYGVGAFADLDRDYRYDDEPVTSVLSSPDQLVRLEEGQAVGGIEMVIEEASRFGSASDPLFDELRVAAFRSQSSQLAVSMGAVEVAGAVTPLSDPRFTSEAARLGYFQINRFLHEHGAGVHFLEPYDPDRIPVLFVHGALGHPGEFADLITGLDRTRFQAWVYSYPSGAPLGPMAGFLSRTVTKLQLRYDFEEMAVVAHSMGGLVARAFIFEQADDEDAGPVRLFVSIATPWAGLPAAESGLKRSHWVVPSWRDIAPDSRFLADLYYLDPEERSAPRTLPEEVAFNVIVGGADVTIPVESAVRWEVLRQADDRWPLAEDHTSILTAPETATLLGEMLEEAFPDGWWPFREWDD